MAFVSCNIVFMRKFYDQLHSLQVCFIAFFFVDFTLYSSLVAVFSHGVGTPLGIVSVYWKDHS